MARTMHQWVQFQMRSWGGAAREEERVLRCKEEGGKTNQVWKEASEDQIISVQLQNKRTRIQAKKERERSLNLTRKRFTI